MGHRPGRRPGRDLERHALLLAALVPRAPASSSCTTSTPRCGAWCSRRPWPGWATRSSAGWRRASTGGSRIVTLSESSRHEIVDMLGPARPSGSRSPRRGSTPASRPAASARPCRWSWPWAGWCRSSASTSSSRPWPRLKADVARPAGHDHRRGLRAPRARGAAGRAGRRRMARAARPRRATRSWSASTAGPGWWPPPRCARGGA